LNTPQPGELAIDERTGSLYCTVGEYGIPWQDYQKSFSDPRLHQQSFTYKSTGGDFGVVSSTALTQGAGWPAPDFTPYVLPRGSRIASIPGGFTQPVVASRPQYEAVVENGQFMVGTALTGEKVVIDTDGFGNQSINGRSMFDLLPALGIVNNVTIGKGVIVACGSTFARDPDQWFASPDAGRSWFPVLQDLTNADVIVDRSTVVFG
jgi:hypothetical protein